MTNTFPFFYVKVNEDYVLACGGGGDVAFGKANGVVMYDINSLQEISFCSTNNDLVDRICILKGDLVSFPFLNLNSNGSSESFEDEGSEEKDVPESKIIETQTKSKRRFNYQEGSEIKSKKDGENDLQNIKDSENEKKSKKDGENDLQSEEDSENEKISEIKSQKVDGINFKTKNDFGNIKIPEINFEKLKNKVVDVKNNIELGFEAKSVDESSYIHSNKEDSVKSHSSEQKTSHIDQKSTNISQDPMKKSLQNQHSSVKDINKNKLTEKHTFLACGFSNFYIMEYDGLRIHIKQTIPVRICHIWTKGSSILFCTDKKEFYGFNDISKGMDLKSYKITMDRINTTNFGKIKRKSTDSRYQIKIYENFLFPTQKNYISTESNWESFYYKPAENDLMKVYVQSNKYYVQHENDLLEYEQRICEIFYDELKKYTYFFTNRQQTKLVLLSKNKKEIDIPQITSLTCSDHVCIGTGDGYAYILNGSLRKLKCLDMPLTSAYYHNGFVYFSSFSGPVEKKRVVKGIKNIFILIFLSIITAIALAYYRNR